MLNMNLLAKSAKSPRRATAASTGTKSSVQDYEDLRAEIQRFTPQVYADTRDIRRMIEGIGLAGRSAAGIDADMQIVADLLIQMETFQSRLIEMQNGFSVDGNAESVESISYYLERIQPDITYLQGLYDALADAVGND